MVTVLVCDDNDALRLLVRMTLEPAGFRVVEAHRGDTIAEAVRRERPDLVLLDYHMPGKDGIEAMEELKEEGLREGTKVVVFTATIGSEDLERVRKFGFDGVLKKPFDVKRLADTISEYLQA